MPLLQVNYGIAIFIYKMCRLSCLFHLVKQIFSNAKSALDVVCVQSALSNSLQIRNGFLGGFLAK